MAMKSSVPMGKTCPGAGEELDFVSSHILGGMKIAQRKKRVFDTITRGKVGIV